MPVPAESFHLSPGAAGTLQQQIRAMVAEGILSGRFPPGARMPSSRGLAAHLGVSRITVSIAYAELVSSDYLTARGRSGYFVSDGAPRPPAFPAPAGRAAPGLDYAALTGERFSRPRGIAKPADWRDYPFPFIYGQPDATLFDHQNWRRCALQALGRRDFEALTSDYHERDDPLLIGQIVRDILPRRGIAAGPEEVLLTLGAQNGLWMAAQVLLGPGRVAAMEEPAYPGLRVILAQAGVPVHAVPVDAAGLPPEAVPAGVDVVFTTASHQCPTNATMPTERRMALLRAASERGFVVVEDDYEFEMSFLKAVSPSLKSLDRVGRVIHVGSFSKSLFPGLRLGYLVGDPAFIREARALRAAVFRHPPGHIQRTLAYFLSLGHYDALMTRMKAAFAQRRAVMAEAIRAEGLEVAGQGEFGGSSFWMRAPEGVDTEVLAARLRAEGVLIEQGRPFFGAEDAPREFYRLAYSSIPAGRIAEGVERIGRGIWRSPKK